MKARHLPPEFLTARHHAQRGARRTLLRVALSGMGTALLAACGTPPPTAPAPAPEPVAGRLTRIGFVATDTGWEFTLSGKLLFEHDAAGLDGEHHAVAERIGRELAGLGIRTVRVEGHTDNVGSDDYNLALSRRRAEAVRRALVAGGLREAAIEIHGMGRSAQLMPNRTAEQRMQNRRVAVIVPAQ